MPEADLLLPTYRLGGGAEDYTLAASLIGLQLPQVIPWVLIHNRVQKRNNCASMTTNHPYPFRVCLNR